MRDALTKRVHNAARRSLSAVRIRIRTPNAWGRRIESLRVFLFIFVRHTSRMSLSLLPVRTSSSPPSVACRASKKAAGATGNAKKKGGDYQEAWFKSTRATLDAQSTTEGRRRVLKEYVEANRKANGGREREDLYTDNWDGAFRRSPVVIPELEPSRAPPSLSLSHTHTRCASLRSFGIQETSTRGTLSTC